MILDKIFPDVPGTLSSRTSTMRPVCLWHVLSKPPITPLAHVLLVGNGDDNEACATSALENSCVIS